MEKKRIKLEEEERKEKKGSKKEDVWNQKE